MVAGLGNPVGTVWVGDYGAPAVIIGKARNERISGGVFVFASGAADVVSSGTNSFTQGDLLFTRDASGNQFNGINLYTTAVSGAMSVATRGVFIVLADGTVTGGVKQQTVGGNAVSDAGSVAANVAALRTIGRALTGTVTSGNYVMFDLNP